MCLGARVCGSTSRVAADEGTKQRSSRLSFTHALARLASISHIIPSAGDNLILPGDTHTHLSVTRVPPGRVVEVVAVKQIYSELLERLGDVDVRRSAETHLTQNRLPHDGGLSGVAEPAREGKGKHYTLLRATRAAPDNPL